MTKQTGSAWGVGVLAVLAALLLIQCGDGGSSADDGAADEQATVSVQDLLPTVDSPEAENPDRGRWVDLSKEPWRPEAVGGTLVRARQSAPRTLNNLTRRSASDRTILSHLLCPYLLEVGPDAGPDGFTPSPSVARELPSLSADHLVSTWVLRDDLTWEDGTPLTAGDYAFTWELMQDPQVPCTPRRSSLEFVESVKAVDDHTLEVRFKRPYYNAVPIFGIEFSVVPAHRVKDPKAFGAVRQHLGFGPYRIVEWNERRLLFELRPEYKENAFPLWPCYVEKIDIRFLDAAAFVPSLAAGEVDLAAIPSRQFERLGSNDQFRSRCWRTLYDLPGYHMVVWNTKSPDNPDLPHPILGDPRVRRAMTMLVDRDHIIESLRGGFAKKVNGPYWHRDVDYDATVPNLSYDPAASRRLLEKLGWKLNEKGFLEKEGQVFRIELACFDRPLWSEPCAIIRDGARKAGVDIIVKPSPWPPLEETIYSHKFDAFIIGQSLRPPVQPDQYELFHSSEARKRGNNWGGVTNSNIDMLLERTRTEFDAKKRIQLRRMFHRLFDQEHPYTVLHTAYSTVGVSRRWANVKVHDLGIWYRDFVLRDRFWK